LQEEIFVEFNFAELSLSKWANFVDEQFSDKNVAHFGPF